MKQANNNDAILADWDTGEYSKAHGGRKTQRDLAYKHRVSLGKISKLVKGREPLNAGIVNSLVLAKQSLAEQNEQSVNAVNAVVDERTKHIQFFTAAAVLNVKTAVDKIGPDTTQIEHRMLADTILKGRETVLGKTVEIELPKPPSNDVPPGTISRIERVILDHRKIETVIVVA